MILINMHYQTCMDTNCEDVHTPDWVSFAPYILVIVGLRCMRAIISMVNGVSY